MNKKFLTFSAIISSVTLALATTFALFFNKRGDTFTKAGEDEYTITFSRETRFYDETTSRYYTPTPKGNKLYYSGGYSCFFEDDCFCTIYPESYDGSYSFLNFETPIRLIKRFQIFFHFNNVDDHLEVVFYSGYYYAFSNGQSMDLDPFEGQTCYVNVFNQTNASYPDGIAKIDSMIITYACS